jgi:hypothetical protein
MQSPNCRMHRAIRCKRRSVRRTHKPVRRKRGRVRRMHSRIRCKHRSIRRMHKPIGRKRRRVRCQHKPVRRPGKCARNECHQQRQACDNLVQAQWIEFVLFMRTGVQSSPFPTLGKAISGRGALDFPFSSKFEIGHAGIPGPSTNCRSSTQPKTPAPRPGPLAARRKSGTCP